MGPVSGDEAPAPRHADLADDRVLVRAATRAGNLRLPTAPCPRAAYHQLSMCMQCMIGAMSAGATATGVRAWLVARSPSWLTPTRQRLLTRTLLVLGVLTAGVIGPSAG